MLNLVALMGRLTRDPEPKTTSSGVSVTSFTLAVERDYVKQGEERQTDFIDVVAWRNTADFVCKYFRKGQLVAVQGAIQTRSYTDKEGHTRKAVEVVASNVHFAEGKKEQSKQTPPSPSASNQAHMEYAKVPTPDDDLPF